MPIIVGKLEDGENQWKYAIQNNDRKALSGGHNVETLENYKK